MSQVSYIVIPEVNNVYDFKLSKVDWRRITADTIAEAESKRFKNTLYVVWELTPKINNKVVVSKWLNGELLPINEW